MAKRRSRKTVLVVEDEADVRAFVKRVLNLEGYSVLEAEDGGQGLSELRRPDRGIDLVLLDLKLPVEDGWAVLQQMKEEPHLRDIPVIVFSAFAGGDSQDKARLLNASGYLVKPLSSRLLAENVRRALGLGV